MSSDSNQDETLVNLLNDLSGQFTELSKEISSMKTELQVISQTNHQNTVRNVTSNLEVTFQEASTERGKILKNILDTFRLEFETLNTTLEEIKSSVESTNSSLVLLAADLYGRLDSLQATVTSHSDSEKSLITSSKVEVLDYLKGYHLPDIREALTTFSRSVDVVAGVQTNTASKIENLTHVGEELARTLLLNVEEVSHYNNETKLLQLTSKNETEGLVNVLEQLVLFSGSVDNALRVLKDESGKLTENVINFNQSFITQNTRSDNVALMSDIAVISTGVVTILSLLKSSSATVKPLPK